MLKFLPSLFKNFKQKKTVFLVFLIRLKLRFNQFFSYLFKKQKKVIFLALLVFVAVGVIVPQTVSAFTWKCIFFGAIGCVVSWVVPEAADTAGGIIIKGVVTGLAAIPVILSTIFATIVGKLLIMVVNLSVSEVKYTASVAVTQGWPIVRNFANMVIVLALIVIALATILRFKNYEAKQLLARLIVAALLINFSLVICGVVIDASNVVMKSFLLQGQTANSTAVSFFTGENNITDPEQPKDAPPGAPLKKVNAMDLLVRGFIKDETIITYTARIISYLFMNLMQGIVGILFVLLFLFRIMALWILVILSPLAFACAVLPATQEYFKKWLSQFLQWSFIGAVAAMFIYLGNKINSAVLGTPEFKGFAGGLDVISFFVPGMFLVIGFIFSLQISAMGSGAAISAGKWARDKTVGAVKSGSKAAFNKAAEKSGATNAVRSVQNNFSDRVNRFREQYLGAAPGTARAGEVARNKARIDKGFEENIKHENNVTALSAYRNKRGTTQAQKAVIDNRLAEMGSFDQIGKFNDAGLTPAQKLIEEKKQKEEQRIAMENMVNHGMDTKEILKKSPSLAGFDPDAFNERKGQLQASGKYTTNDAVREALVVSARKKASLTDVSKNEVTHELIDLASDKKLRKSRESMDIEREQQIKDLGSDAEDKRLLAVNSGNLTEAKRWAKRRDRIELMFK